MSRDDFVSVTRSPFFRILGRSFLVAVSVMLVAFSLMRLAPGDPVVVLLGDQATTENIADMRALLGLNGSYPEQLVHYVQGLASGDMGKLGRLRRAGHDAHRAGACRSPSS